MVTMQSQAQYVLRTVEERGVRFVQLWFTDVLGRHKAFHVTPAELEDALDQGMTFDGSAIDGFSRVQESDVLARPDLTTFQLLPWYHEGAGVARVFCDIANIDGSPFEGCPRQQLRRVLDGAREQGYTFFVAPEVEYFYFEDLDAARGPRPLDRGSYFDLLPDDTGSQLRRRTVLMLEEMGIGVEHAQHEDAPGQHEIDLRYTDALDHGRHRDDRAPRRQGARAPGGRRGELHAQAPRRRPGLGDAHAPVAVARRAQRLHRRGPLRTERRWPRSSSPASCATPARSPPSPTSGSTPTSASCPALEAPVGREWARHDAAALVRVPSVKPGRVDSTRVEYRSPDPAANPYLAFAVILAAGLRGVVGDYELPAEGERTAPAAPVPRPGRWT